MANVTVYEFQNQPDGNGNPLWPTIKAPTTVAVPGTVTLDAKTLFVLIGADADCRCGFNTTAVASGKTILSAIDNPMNFVPAGSSFVRTLNFL